MRKILAFIIKVKKNCLMPPSHILLTKTTAAGNEDALSYLRVRGLYFLAVVFAATINVEIAIKLTNIPTKVLPNCIKLTDYKYNIYILGPEMLVFCDINTGKTLL